MKLNSHIIGQKGEEFAARFLMRKGYDLLARNFRTKFGEIDLIVKKGLEIVFVEVKTRKYSSYFSGHDAVGSKKRQHMLRAAGYYIASLPQEFSFRFDVIVITYHEAIPPQVEHIEAIEM